jgi:YD repeat-containing protein
MFVQCDLCKYDSGDRDSTTELAAKVNADGGKMEMQYDDNGKPKGWNIACPKGHDGDSIRLD